MSWWTKARGFVIPGASGLDVLDTLKSGWDDFTGKSAADAAADAQREANQANVDLWREQSEYNTPANQVARLRASGLNPNLFYTQGNTGNASSAPTVSPVSRYSFNASKLLDYMSVVLQLQNMAAQNRNLNAQTANIDAQTSMRETEAEVQKLQVDYFRKYGYFPNQGTFSMGRQFMQDIFGSGRFMNNLDALREIAAQKINSSYGDSGMRAIDMALEAADKKHLTGQKRADFINDFIIKYNKAH